MISSRVVLPQFPINSSLYLSSVQSTVIKTHLTISLSIQIHQPFHSFTSAMPLSTLTAPSQLHLSLSTKSGRLITAQSEFPSSQSSHKETPYALLSHPSFLSQIPWCDGGARVVERGSKIIISCLVEYNAKEKKREGGGGGNKRREVLAKTTETPA